jgi:ubiquinone/menaquinone biosynthesis C-methylase UbiE
MFLKPQEIFSYLPLHAGARVADFGTGAGHYAFLAAERLDSNGAVYAFDLRDSFIDKIRKEGERYSATVYALRHDLNKDIPLRDNLLDAAVVANVLHQLDARETFVRELARVLGAGGKALVIDWAASFKNMGPKEGRTLAPGEAARLFREAGFQTGEMLPAGTHHFAFVATLPVLNA